MTYIDDLKRARDRYAAELASRQGPPDVRWDEYEAWLREQIEAITRIINESHDIAAEAPVAQEVWRVGQAVT